MKMLIKMDAFKVTYESQLKELEHKQELLFEASKAFEVLQKEHKIEVDTLLGEKEKEVWGLKAQTTCLGKNVNELQSKMSTTINKANIRRYETQVKEFRFVKAPSLNLILSRGCSKMHFKIQVFQHRKT